MKTEKSSNTAPAMPRRDFVKKSAALAVEVTPIERPPHMLDWLQCIRTGATPNASIEAGYQHAVAVLMVVVSYETGRKTTYDAKQRLILPA
jgi:hypothetical protein